MKKIWKYPLSQGPWIESGIVTINMPLGAKILSLGVQDGVPTLWALVDPDAEKSPRAFFVAGTGDSIYAPHGEFVGTVLVGPFVWHVFQMAQGAQPS